MLKLSKQNWNPREDYSFRFWLANLILGGRLRSFIDVSLQGFIANLNNNLEDVQEILADPNNTNTSKYTFVDTIVKRIKREEEYLGKDVYDIFGV